MGLIVLVVGGVVLLFVAVPAITLRILARQLERRISVAITPEEIVLPRARPPAADETSPAARG